MARHAGLILPLFSGPASASWGIGEFPDLDPLAEWMASAGLDRLMLLPLGTMAPGQSSPYSAQSAMALDPIYIALEAMEDFIRAGGVPALSEAARKQLAAAQASPRVAHAAVRAAKREALGLAFVHFLREEWEPLTVRAAALASYIARERSWLDDYALFEALSDSMPSLSWRQWPEPLRDRDPHALSDARRQLAIEVLRQQYGQWIAEHQWQAARASAAHRGIRVVGDLPFVVNTHSADVWTRQADFLLDVSAGAPPDAFSPTGQDWGLPTYRWDAIRATEFVWIRQRAWRMAALFDGFRIDHLVGFYRTYGKPPGGPPFFTPAEESAQLTQGEAILRICLETGAEVVAEDLGTVPDFVRASLARMGVPGSKVLRWERAWHEPGQPFVDPASYPAASVALTGTHDTQPLALWWETAPADERGALAGAPFAARDPAIDPGEPWNGGVRDWLLETVFASGSDHAFTPVQDLFGWRDRINTPATVSDANWSWRLPWPVDRLPAEPAAVERAAFCRRLAAATGRTAR